MIYPTGGLFGNLGEWASYGATVGKRNMVAAEIGLSSTDALTSFHDAMYFATLRCIHFFSFGAVPSFLAAYDSRIALAREYAAPGAIEKLSIKIVGETGVTLAPL